MIACLSVFIHACGYHLGNPTPAVGLAVGDVRAPVAQADLSDLLQEALAAAIRRQGVSGLQKIDMTVVDAEFSPSTGSGGEISSWTAHLEVRFQLSGPKAHDILLQRSTAVASASGGAAGLESSRSRAFEWLAAVLTEEAVALLSFAGGS